MTTWTEQKLSLSEKLTQLLQTKKEAAPEIAPFLSKINNPSEPLTEEQLTDEITALKKAINRQPHYRVSTADSRYYSKTHPLVVKIKYIVANHNVPMELVNTDTKGLIRRLTRVLEKETGLTPKVGEYLKEIHAATKSYSMVELTEKTDQLKSAINKATNHVLIHNHPIVDEINAVEKTYLEKLNRTHHHGLTFKDISSAENDQKDALAYLTRAIVTLESHVTPFCLDRLFDAKYVPTAAETLSPFVESLIDKLNHHSLTLTLENLSVEFKKIASDLNKEARYYLSNHPISNQLLLLSKEIDDALLRQSTLNLNSNVKPVIISKVKEAKAQQSNNNSKWLEMGTLNGKPLYIGRLKRLSPKPAAETLEQKTSRLEAELKKVQSSNIQMSRKLNAIERPNELIKFMKSASNMLPGEAKKLLPQAFTFKASYTPLRTESIASTLARSDLENSQVEYDHYKNSRTNKKRRR